jgi:hypothetical protein
MNRVDCSVRRRNRDMLEHVLHDRLGAAAEAVPLEKAFAL